MSIYIRKDRWTPTEDKIINAAVMKYGTNQWSRVASLLVRKSAVQCKARWYEHLSPKLSHNDWTPREDMELLKISKAMPNMWRSIGATLGGRTATQCFERWKHLNDTQNSDVIQELLADEGTDDSEDSETNSDSERQMMAEAKARLSNNLGKKANRKQRERLEDEEAFRQSIENHRATGSAIRVKQSKFAIDYNQGIPYETIPSVVDTRPVIAAKSSLFKKPASSRQPGSKRRVPRRPRKRLELSTPVSTIKNGYDGLVFDDDAFKKYLDRLRDLPPPRTSNTLESLASLLPEDEYFDEVDDVIDQSVEHAEPRKVSNDCSFAELLKSQDESIIISTEARRLLKYELANISRKSKDHESFAVIQRQVSDDLSPLNHKYELLQQRLLDSTKAVRSQ